jgi:hypothetical protein
LPLSRVHIGFFRDFNSSDTVLIDGDSSGLRLLADTFRSLANSVGSVAIDELPFVEVHHGIRIAATVGERDNGASINGLDVSWERSADGWQDAADKLDVLETAAAGHQYLDASSDRVTVRASIGEYSDSWWTQNG